MSDPLQVKVSRDGKEIGTYPVQEAIRLLVYGTLKETDHYWHDGMAEWAPLVQLQASEARRQLAERALQQKQEEERKAAELVKKRLEEAEKLRQEKEEQEQLREDRIRAEVVRRRGNFFTCNCCKASFEKPYDPRDLFWKGLGLIFLGFLCGSFVVAMMGSSRSEPPVFIAFCFMVVSAVLTLWGSILVLSSGLRSPFCPGCHSTDYSRPNSDIRPVFE
jgi:GYF domain 2